MSDRQLEVILWSFSLSALMDVNADISVEMLRVLDGQIKRYIRSTRAKRKKQNRVAP